MCRSIFAIMAVTLRMSSAVRLYIVHSAKEKRRSSQDMHLFTVFTVRMLHERNKQPCDALFKSVIWQCLKPTSIFCRLAQTIQLSVRTGVFPLEMGKMFFFFPFPHFYCVITRHGASWMAWAGCDDIEDLWWPGCIDAEICLFIIYPLWKGVIHWDLVLMHIVLHSWKHKSTITITTS